MRLEKRNKRFGVKKGVARLKQFRKKHFPLPVPLKLKFAGMAFMSVVFGWLICRVGLAMMLPGWAEEVFLNMFDRFMFAVFSVICGIDILIVLYTVWLDEKKVFTILPDGGGAVAKGGGV